MMKNDPVTLLMSHLKQEKLRRRNRAYTPQQNMLSLDLQMACEWKRPCMAFCHCCEPWTDRNKLFTVADTSGEYVKNVKRWMLRPEFVAKRIVDVMLTPTREVNLPFWMHIGSRLYQLFPAVIEKWENGHF